MAKQRKKAEAEQQARVFIRGALERMRWLFDGHYPAPEEWEEPMIAQTIERAMRGDDSALAWLKQRFPPKH